MTPSRPGPLAQAAVRIVPAALLLVLGMVGLRGTTGTPRFNGPLKQDGVAIGTGLAAVLAALLIVTVVRYRRWRRAEPDAVDLDTAAKLRVVLMFVLSAGIAADIVTILVGLHLKVFLPARHLPQTPAPPTGSPGKHTQQAQHGSSGPGHFPVSVIYYILLVVAVLVVIYAITRWARMLQPPGVLTGDEPIAEDAEKALREAVQEGRRALLTFDDARAAIIACYAAMEERLAQRGAARTLADTPDELLARATKAGIITGPAAATLTRLFYEARFSTHPMDGGQRDEAEQALNDLAGSIREEAQP